MRNLLKKGLMLFIGAESHDLFDASTIIPRTVEKNDFARRRQVLDVALEIPLSPLALGGNIECDDSRVTRIQVLHETLYGTALARRVTALKDHYNAAARILDPVLELQQ